MKGPIVVFKSGVKTPKIKSLIFKHFRTHNNLMQDQIQDINL